MNEVIKNNSELLYNQAKQQFEKLEAAYEAGQIEQEQQLVEQVFKAFEAFFAYAGEPNFYARFAYADGPMWSEDYNDMMDEIMLDFRNLYREAELLSAGLSADFNHHVVQENLLNNSYNKTLDKLKDLEMYNDIGNTGTRVYARDHFLNTDKIDYDKITTKALEIENGNLTLPVASVVNVADAASITIIPGNKREGELLLGSDSNGFPGNNTEVIMENNNALTIDGYEPAFVGSENVHGNYYDVLDDNPNTWFEYEKVALKEHDIQKVAKNYGFGYEVTNGQTVSWIGEPENGVLRLTMQIVLDKLSVINSVSVDLYVPSNLNAVPAKITNILVGNGTDSLESVLTNPDSVTGTSFYFTPREAKVVQITFEQDQKYATDIGHVFFQEKTVPLDKQNYAIEMLTKTSDFENRVEGKLLNVADMGMRLDQTSQNVSLYYPLVNETNGEENRAKSMNERLERLNISANDNIDYGIEKFEGYRWCIGIRDIKITQVEFEEEGELITKPFYFEQEIEKISLDIDEGDTLSQDWLSYYVSIDDGSSWYPITPMKHATVDDIPKIYTIKKVEEQSQVLDSDSSYIETSYPIYSLRLKIVGKKVEEKQDDGWIQTFAAPKEKDTTPSVHTPILNSFKIAVDLNQKSNALTSNIVLEAPDSITRSLDNEDPGDENQKGDGTGTTGPGGNGTDKPHNDDSKIKVEILEKPEYQLQLCQNVDLQINAHIKTPYELRQMNVYIDREFYTSKTYAGTMQEALESIYIPHKLFPQNIGDSFVVMVEATDSKGENSKDTIVISIIDCSTKPGGTSPTDPNNPNDPSHNPGGTDGGNKVTNGSITITQFPTDKEYGNGHAYPYMCEEDWLALSNYSYKGRVDSTSAITKIEFYEDGKIVRTETFDPSEYRLTYAFEQPVNVQLYTASLDYSYPQVVAYAVDGSSATAIYKIDVHECKDGGSSDGDDVISILNKAPKWCYNKTFSIKVYIQSKKKFTKVELYADGKLMNTKKALSIHSLEFQITPDKLVLGSKITYVIKAYTDDGYEISTSEITEFVDCTIEDADDNVFKYQLSEFSGSVCMCDTDKDGNPIVYTIGGSTKSTAGIQGIQVFVRHAKVNGGKEIEFDYMNIMPDSEPDQDYCSEWFLNNTNGDGTGSSGNEPDITNGKDGTGDDSDDGSETDSGTNPEDGTGSENTGSTDDDSNEPTEPEDDRYIITTGTFDNGLTEPSEDITFLNSTSHTYNTNYWEGNHQVSTPVNGHTIYDEFWKGRNSWLDILDDLSGNTPDQNYKSAKVDTSDPFYDALYYFSQNCDSVKLPTPFSKFYSWGKVNLPRLSRLQLGSIYATWLFKKPSIVSESASNYLNDYVLDTIAHYMTNPKIKPFTFHWIDFADVESDPNVLAWVMDLSITAFLSYVNFEDTAMNASIGNMKAIRPIDYTATVGLDFYGGYVSLLNEDYAKYNLATPNFGKGLDYFEVNEQVPENIIGIYAGVESAIHEIGHAISNYGADAYKTKTVQKYSSDVGKILHEYKEWLEISGWDALTNISAEDGKLKFQKSNAGSLLDNGKEAPVSAYGCVSAGEDFAEAFDFYVVNPELLKKYWPKKYAFMEKYVKDMPSVEIEIKSVMESLRSSINEGAVPVAHNIRKEAGNALIVEDFGDWLEQFEIDENCGCKKPKRNGHAAWRTNKNEALAKTQREGLVMAKSDLTSDDVEVKKFKFSIPSWWFAKYLFPKYAAVMVSVVITNNDGQVGTLTVPTVLLDCRKEEDRPKDGSTITRSCYELQDVVVRYFDYGINDIKEVVIDEKNLNYKWLSNGGGGAMDIGWSSKYNGVVIKQVLGSELPGIQIEGVGIHYLDLDGKVLEEWAKSIPESSDGNRNIDMVIGDPIANTLNDNWVEFAKNGDFSDAPSLGGKDQYAIFKFSEDWDTKGCMVGINYDWTKPPETPPVEVFECEAKQFIALQYYDDLSDRLRYLQIDIRGQQGTVYELPQESGIAKIIVGWSSYFTGPVIQIKEADGEKNVLLTAIGIVYRDKWGSSQVKWSNKLRYTTNGAHNMELVTSGFKKSIEEVKWINSNGEVDWENATYLGKVSDIAAYYINLSSLTNACKTDSDIDDELDIDLTNPPDVPKVEWTKLIDSACHGYTGSDTPNEFAGIIKSETPFKEVMFTITVDGSVKMEQTWPFAEGITEKDFDFVFAGYDYPVGSEIIFTITTTNIYDRFSSEIVKFTVEQCYDGTVTISTVPDFPMTFYYEDLPNGETTTEVNFKMVLTDDLVGVKHYEITTSDGINTSKNILQNGLLSYTTNITLPITLPAKVAISNIPESLASNIKADIVFVFDTSGSMTGLINSVKNGLSSFKQQLVNKHINANMGYTDSNFNNDSLYQELIPAESFNLNPIGINGGDWEGLNYGQLTDEEQGAARFLAQFRTAVPRMIFLVTDTYVYGNTTTIEEAVNFCKRNDMVVFPLLSNSTVNTSAYYTIANGTGGAVFRFSESSFPVQDLVNLIIQNVKVYPDTTKDVTIKANNQYGVEAIKNGKVHFTYKEL